MRFSLLDIEVEEGSVPGREQTHPDLVCFIDANHAIVISSCVSVNTIKTAKAKSDVASTNYTNWFLGKKQQQQDFDEDEDDYEGDSGKNKDLLKCDAIKQLGGCLRIIASR